ncbi:flagellar basal body P-ring formation chaperone FlgA [Alloalcanivorax profundimaris]|uniref:flagellar basal body P-ring formation chaperone FlgA n=1 Tax=Alloalcanivorax profundimaris TaxID=2735259 RepID=UPI0018870ABE|nr:flagellar basal body P-ring formation chaperone FlgA [Alloalcanivorax profundimaris]MBF1800793.1 flagellar basal body P-ring formation protein FlgA [Alloalcanivorax profundimaris]
MNARCLQRGPRRLAALLAGLLLVPAAPGAPLDDAPADDAVATRVQAYLEERAAGLDGRVSVTVAPATAAMPPCPSPRPFMPGREQPLAGRVTVGVHCDDGGATVRYRRARVSVIGDYWVTARRLEAGTVIDDGALERRHGDLAALPDQAVLDKQALLGREARRALAAGQVPRAHQIRKPPLVARRQTVTLVAGGDGFRITREGHALDEAALGGPVRVRLPNREVVTARVTGPGEARVSY